jgi:hypothetical protein
MGQVWREHDGRPLLPSIRARYVPERMSHCGQSRSLTVSAAASPPVSQSAGGRSAAASTSQADSSHMRSHDGHTTSRGRRSWQRGDQARSYRVRDGAGAQGSQAACRCPPPSFPYDISSPPRKIETKAFGRSARGAPIPLEERQVKAARENPENFYLYVVDNIADEVPGKIAVRVLHGPVLRAMLDSAAPHITYWPTLRTSDYDQMTTGIG